MRKYEPAGGVLPMNWKAGEPQPNEVYGRILAEVWRLEWGWDGAKVSARFVVLDRTMDGDRPIFARLGGARLGTEEKVRRWCNLGRMNSTTVQPTLGDW